MRSARSLREEKECPAMKCWERLIDRRSLLLVILAASVLSAPTGMNITAVAVGSHSAAETSYDVVIYGGTSGGVAAAVQARRMGKSVVLIEPTRRLGGLTTGGLGQTDIGNKAAIGGIAREFYQAVRKHYDDPAAWKWQTRAEYADSGQTRTASGEDAMWTFEPSAALKIFNDWVRENRLEVVYGERLDRKSGVAMTRSIPWRIIAIRMESGRTFPGRMFIDATYEGDLMAAANVSYTVGREANAQYDETLNGVQTKQAKYHQLVPGLDPYVTPRRSRQRPAAVHRSHRPGRRGRRRSSRAGVLFSHVPDGSPRQPHPVSQAGGLRRTVVRTAVAELRGRRARHAVDQFADAQPQDGHEQPPGLLHRLHRPELRLPGGLLRATRADRGAAPPVPAGLDVDAGQPPADSGSRPPGVLALGHVPG